GRGLGRFHRRAPQLPGGAAPDGPGPRLDVGPRRGVPEPAGRRARRDPALPDAGTCGREPRERRARAGRGGPGSDPHHAGRSRGDLRAVLRAARGRGAPPPSSPPADPVLPEALSRLLLPLPGRVLVLVGALLGRDDGVRGRLAYAPSARAPSPARRSSVPPASLS